MTGEPIRTRPVPGRVGNDLEAEVEAATENRDRVEARRPSMRVLMNAEDRLRQALDALAAWDEEHR